MASRQFFDPLVLLRTAPLITATASLWHSIDQWQYYRIFTMPENRKKSNVLLPSYWKSVLYGSALRSVILLNTLTISAATANLLMERPVLNLANSARWYGFGLACTIGHFAFVPAVMWKIKAIIEDTSMGQSTRDLDAWLDVHKLRTLTVDLLSWAGFLMTVITTLKA